MRAGDLSKLEFQRLSTNITWELLLLILERYRPRKQFFFEVRSSLFLHHPVIENCLFQCAVKQPIKLMSWTTFFLCQHFTKRIQSSADGTSRLVTSSLTSLWAFSRASVLTHQLTYGKSNQSTNLQTHSGLEGILSNHMYYFVCSGRRLSSLNFSSTVYCLPNSFCEFWHV